jgi:flavodoxin I
MQKAIVVYGSTTGNTEELAGYIGRALKSGGIGEVHIKNVTDTDVNELLDYEIILLGSSTWGDGELQDDYFDFFEALNKMDLTGKKAAAFGTGESSWSHFCAAVDTLQERLTKCGAEVAEGFKVDGIAKKRRCGMLGYDVTLYYRIKK